MKRHAPVLLFVICVAIFVVGIVQLFRLRFEAGDVYPPYSSLRSDPLGTMVFYESLERLSDVTVRRDFSTENRLPEARETVYFHIAGDPFEWRRMPEGLFREVEQFVTGGGRLVITLSPQSTKGSRLRNREQWGRTNSPTAKNNQEEVDKTDQPNDPRPQDPLSPQPKKKRPIPDKDRSKWVSPSEKWGIEFELIELLQGEDGHFEPVIVECQTGSPLPESLGWHSGIVLTNVDPAWETIYARGANAVLIERSFGRGSVVVATDSYFLSNEAMQNDRHADLLAWTVGAGKNIVFDEAHLGVAETPGMATLLRKYRLYWVAAGLILLGGLFIWKNAFSLVPPPPDERTRNHVIGKEASAGFVNLLRRSIPARDLFATCFAEWKKTATQAGRISNARLHQAEAAFQAENSLPFKERNPLRAVKQIHEILNKRSATVNRQTVERTAGTEQEISSTISSGIKHHEH